MRPTHHLVTTEQAAAIWGCTPRHIQWLTTAGELVPVRYTVVRHAIQPHVVMAVRRPLFDPADVLKLRAAKKASKRAHCAAMFAANRERIRATNGALGRRLANVWRRMPKAERVKWGRRWRKGALLWMRRRNDALA